MTSKLVVNTIEADTGISSVSFASSISMDSTSKFHFSAAGVDIGADTNINRPAAGVLGFNINSSEKARIDSSGRLLLGTTTEGHTSGDDLTIATSDTTGITLRGGSSGGGRIFFSDGTSGDAEYEGVVGYDHGTNHLYFSTNHTEKLRITSDGKVGIGSVIPANSLDVQGTAHAKIHIGTTGTSHATGIQINHAKCNAALQEWQLQTDASADGNLIVRNATSGTSTMFFDADNNHVGINDTSPDTKLSVNSGATDVVAKFTSSDSNAWIQFRDNSTTDTGVMIGANGDNLLFRAGSNERARITSAGNVTVGGHTAALSTYNSSQPRLSIYKSSGSGGYLELGGNISNHGHSSGTILFINNDNSDATNNNANGKILAMQRVENVTSDTNAGDDMGGDLAFHIKPEAGSLTERLRIHSTGQVTKPASCAFNVTPNGNQSLGSGETLTSWKTTDSRGFENTTTGGYFGSGIFTAPVTGAYYFTSNILLYDTNGTNSIHLYWQKNGSGTHTYWNTRFNSGDFGYGNYMPVAGACTMYMSAGDTCRIRISFTGSNCGMYGGDQNWGNWGGFLIG